MKNFFYRISLYTNIIKYKIRNLFKPISNNENLIFLKEYFKDKKKGIYIDVGCFHPIRLSNTMFLYEKNWKGINIDLSEKSIDLFNLCRPKDINLNFGVGSKNEKLEYFYNKEIFQSNTFNNSFAKNFLKKEDLKKKLINVTTLSNLIENHLPGKKIDLIDIDAEGFDLEVLKGIKFDTHEIDLIMIEVHDYDEKTNKVSKEILELLNSKNFHLLYGNYPGNCIFKYSL
jgi:FkbM family methyltransferase